MVDTEEINIDITSNIIEKSESVKAMHEHDVLRHGL